MILPMQRPSDKSTSKRQRAVGRPRAFTLDEILDAAIALGLADLSMSAVAARLGTATATLYNYVSNREQLIRLAALKQARMRSIEDVGQDWQTLVRNHATSFFELFAAEPQLITQYMQGAIGPDLLLDYIESFLAAMQRRGFSAADSSRLFSIVNTVVLGAVVRSSYLRALEENSQGYRSVIRRALRDRDPAELPLLRSDDIFAIDTSQDGFDEILDSVVASFSAEIDLSDGVDPLAPNLRSTSKKGRAGAKQQPTRARPSQSRTSDDE